MWGVLLRSPPNPPRASGESCQSRPETVEGCPATAMRVVTSPSMRVGHNHEGCESPTMRVGHNHEGYDKSGNPRNRSGHDHEGCVKSGNPRSCSGHDHEGREKSGNLRGL